MSIGEGGLAGANEDAADTKETLLAVLLFADGLNVADADALADAAAAAATPLAFIDELFSTFGADELRAGCGMAGFMNVRSFVRRPWKKIKEKLKL